MKSEYGFGRFSWRAFRIILFISVVLLICTSVKAENQPITWDMVYVHIYDWWAKTSSEKIEVREIKPIILSNNELAFLAGAWFMSRGRNFIDGAVLVRPTLKEVREVSAYVSPGFEVRDLDHDGVSEIIAQTLGSGQGTTRGARYILQFDGWNPVIIHKMDFEDNSGACVGRDNCYTKSVEWQFLELRGKTNVLELVHHSSDSSHSRTEINVYTFRHKKFTRLKSTELQWDTPAGSKPKNLAKNKKGKNQIPEYFAEYRGNSRYFDALARVYRESIHKPALPFEIEELIKKAGKVSKDRSYNLNAAISMYNEALRKFSWWSSGYYKRAFLHEELGQFGSAIQDMERYLLLEPAAPDADASQQKIKVWKETLQHQEFEEMVVIPEGEFMMGSLSCTDGLRYSWANKLYCDNELPQHRVSIKRFEMSKYNVTFDQWNACVSDGGCKGYRQDGKRPVNPVSWQDTQSYIAWLNKKTGKRYRLPTEAEWEYAARAGTTTNYYWGDKADDRYANIHKGVPPWGADENVTPVGAFPPNGFGLYDMSGNVWQFVEDCYHDNYEGAPTDGSAWIVGDCSVRVRRGGSWHDSNKYARSTARSAYRKTDTGLNNGFRIARSLE